MPDISHFEPSSGNGGVRPRVCLVSALNMADFGDPETTIRANGVPTGQLGVLSLAASLREAGFEPHLIDLDHLFLSRLARQIDVDRAVASTGPSSDPDSAHPLTGTPQAGTDDFFSTAAELLKSSSYDVFGFSSICSSYPLTLRLANEVRRWHPRATIVLGGPQASAVDVATMTGFPSVDFVVRGEADETFPALLRLLSCPDDARWVDLPGITYRHDGRVIRNAGAPPPRDLDCLPLPAFDLDPFDNRERAIPLEIGRGCPFACTFCSTSDFFRRQFRLKSPGKIVAEMQRARQECGTDHFGLVHDLYTVDRKRVLAFCEALEKCDEQFVWACSARTDCIDDELIDRMAAAGCQGMFFGVETGSARMQGEINKRLDLREARKRILASDRNGIQTAVSFIIGFPDETRDDLRQTVHFFLDMMRLDHAEPQVGLLAPLAGTPIYEQYCDRLVFDRIFSDMSHQGWRRDPAELEMIEANPEVFPNFYAVPTTWLKREYLQDVTEFLTFVGSWFRWLPVALMQDHGDFLAVFDRWRSWRSSRSPRTGDEEMGQTPYYAHRRFSREYLEFVDECYVPEMARARFAIRALIRTEGTAAEARGDKATRGTGERGVPARREDVTAASAAPPTEVPPPGSVPRLRDGLVLIDLDVDYRKLIDCLRKGEDLAHVAQRPCTVVFLPNEERQTQVWQLAPMSARLLALCDGKRTVAQLMNEFSPPESELGGISAGEACLFGLAKLQKDGFLDFVAV